MEPIYSNGLIQWDAHEVLLRQQLTDMIVLRLTEAAQGINKAWTFHRTEMPLLLPKTEVNPQYGPDDILITQVESEPGVPLVLRPETTAGSYTLAKALVDKKGRKALPLVVYQLGQSFRNEQDKALKHMRLKAFYQLEFQFIYDKTSKADYPLLLGAEVNNILQSLMKAPSYLEPSDRLPSYSLNTTDILFKAPEDYKMEVCSMSERIDSPIPDTKNFEVAIGMDRLVYLVTHA